MSVAWLNGLIPCVFVCCLGIGSEAAGAQDQLREVERLYFGAAYEEALAVLARLERDERLNTPEAAEYRVLCLLALGRVEPARGELEKLLRRMPDYRPDPRRSSPRLQEQFELVRRRLLPDRIRVAYADAKALLADRKYTEAAVRFREVLDVLRDADEAEFRETRALAVYFLDFATLASDANRARPVGTSGRSSDGTTQPTIYDASHTDVVPPTALGPLLPQVSSDATLPRTPGLFEILIDESGRVEAASVRRSIAPRYDAQVIREARTWRFKPATRNGLPVKFRKMIEIYAVASPQPPFSSQE